MTTAQKSYQPNAGNAGMLRPRPITSQKQMGKQWPTVLFWAPKSLQMVTAAMELKDAYSFGRKLMANLDSILKSKDITL